MISHRAIVKRFTEGEDVVYLAWYARHHGGLRHGKYRATMFEAREYVEHAIRTVLKRQKWQG